jgi:hypothetical protein
MDIRLYQEVIMREYSAISWLQGFSSHLISLVAGPCVVQANTNTLLSHFISLAVSLILLTRQGRLEKALTEPDAPVEEKTGGFLSRQPPSLSSRCIHYSYQGLMAHTDASPELGLDLICTESLSSPCPAAPWP